MPTDDVVPLRTFLLREVNHLEQQMEVAHQAHADLHVLLQRAIDKGEEQQIEMVKVALEAIDRRLEGMNEFRAAMEDVTRNAVSRDLFDIVTNRVTIVENTYVKKEDYTKDHNASRRAHTQDLEQRDHRLTALERYSVRTEALDLQSAEVARTRKALTFTIIGGVALIVINLLINVIQTAGR